MLKKIIAVAGIGLMTIALCGCGDSKKAEPKEITVYFGTVEQQAKIIAGEFEKDTGIKVKYVRMSGGEILSRIRAEKNSPKASLWYGGSADSFIVAKNEGLLAAYKSSATEKIPANFKDAEGYWTGIYQGYLGFACDKRYFEDKKLPLPSSWDDLLKPELKGKVMMGNPGTASTGYVILSTLCQMRGEEAGLEYMSKLHPQMKLYTKSGAAPVRSAALGECAVGISYHQVALRTIKEGNKNLALSFPKEGTGYELGAMAILKGAPEEAAAKKFVDWAVSKKAQELCQKFGSYQFLTNLEASPLPEVMPYKNTKLIKYDFVQSGKNRKHLVEEWNKIVKK